MPFFGFDTTLRSKGVENQTTNGEPLDFEETYQGLSEFEQEEDYLNSETFGDDANLGTDFDFGYGKNASEKSKSNQPVSSSFTRSTKLYASAASSTQFSQHHQFDENLDLKPMESLWSNNPPELQDKVSKKAQHSGSAPKPQALSMTELEEQQQHMSMMSQQGFMNISSQGLPAPGYGFVSQGYMQQPPLCQPFQNQYPQPGISSQFNQNIPPQFTPVYQMYNQEPQSQSTLQQVSQPLQLHTEHEDIHNLSSHQETPQQQKSQLLSSPRVHQQRLLVSPSSQNQIPTPPHTPRDCRRSQVRRHHEPLTEEEQKRLQIRQAKVDKILKHSGVMTPRDKDFITRYQLSQIVTEDPYNEDFYFQVYKIIQRGGVVSESNKGMIARAYLEHSGHRLGGRYKRADVALQRMQSQVEKAVTVAKERPQKNKDNLDSKEGVLGKISSTMNSKAPRRQLQIPTHKDDEGYSDSILDQVAQSLQNVDITNQKPGRRPSYAISSLDHRSVLSLSGGRVFVLSLIESVYEEILELEAQLRSGIQSDSANLWGALHIDDDSYEVSPFISILSFDKGIKIMPRIMNFLPKEQKMRLFTRFFSELSHLNIIVTSSYKINPNPNEIQLRKISLFQSVFLKIIVSFLSTCVEFSDVMNLLLVLMKNNNIAIICTSKIGLNLITVLISRAALIKQDINRGNSLSSSEISTWSEVYDKLFSSLEVKLGLIFPTPGYMIKYVKAVNSSNISGCSSINSHSDTSSKLQFYDQSYIWQFLASLALGGKLNHQRIIIDEIRDEIFGTISKAEDLSKLKDSASLYQKDKLYQDLNLFLNVMGLVARDGEISELK